MDATSWWSANEAKEHGFVDEVTTGNQTKAQVENRNGALFINSVAVPGAFDDALNLYETALWWPLPQRAVL